MVGACCKNCMLWGLKRLEEPDKNSSPMWECPKSRVSSTKTPQHTIQICRYQGFLCGEKSLHALFCSIPFTAASSCLSLRHAPPRRTFSLFLQERKEAPPGIEGSGLQNLMHSEKKRPKSGNCTRFLFQIHI